MNTETDLYETDAAYVEAWERWVANRHAQPLNVSAIEETQATMLANRIERFFQVQVDAIVHPSEIDL